jgi:outer membrane PBP1 activator LpoA protein
MTEETQEIERLIKQSGELADSLLRLAGKLRQRSWSAAEPAQTESEYLAALVKHFTELASRSGEVMHVIDDDDRRRRQDKAYVTVRRMVESGTITPQQAAVTLLQAAVINKTMNPAAAAEQLAKLLRPDLPVSKKIEIRESAKAAFDTGEDILENIKPFLKGAAKNGQTQEQQQIKKQIAVTP